MSSYVKTGQEFPEENAEISGYFRHFGLRQDPFGVQDKENSLYLLPGWEQQIDLILHYLRHENILLTLTGVKGIGKTTFINFFLLEAIHGFSPTETAVQSNLKAGELLVQLGETVRTCQVFADNALDPTQMLEVIAGAFDITTENGGLEEQGEGLLNALQHCKQSCILLVDKAHDLPDATIVLLLQLIAQQSDAQHQLHVVLIGECDLKKRLAKFCKPKDFQGLAHSVELDPLNLAQTEYYIKHRLAAVGLQGELPFSSGNIHKIYKHSGGVPKIINQLARQLLLDMLKKRNFSSIGAIFKPYKKTLIGGGFLLTSFVIILFYLGQDAKTRKASLEDAYHSVVVERRTMQVPADNPVTLPPSAGPSTEAALPPPQDSSSPPQAQSQPTQSPTLQPGGQETSQPQPLPASDSQQASISAPNLTPSQTVLEASSLVEPNSASDAADTSVKPPFLPAKKSEAQPVQKAYAEEPHSPVSEVAVSNGEKGVQLQEGDVHNDMRSAPVEDPVEEVPSQPKKAPAPTKSKEKNKTLMPVHVNPGRYTLKFTDMSTKSAVKAFVEKYKLGKNFICYCGVLHGASTYVLVYGEYTNAEAARRAIQVLPKSLKQFQPEPFQLGSLQKWTLINLKKS